MLLFDDLVRASSLLSAAISQDGNISNARRRLSAISLQSGVNWVSRDNYYFQKTPDWRALMQSMTQQSLAGMTASRHKRSSGFAVE
jgi:hypothetical protein